MSKKPYLRACVRRLVEGKAPEMIGVIVHISDDGYAWVSLPPEARKGGQGKAKRFYWKKPQKISLAVLQSCTEDLRYEFLPEVPPLEWSLDEEQLRGTRALPIGLSRHAHLLSARGERRDADYDLIRSIVENHTIGQLLESKKLLAALVSAKVAELGMKSSDVIYRLVNKFIHSGGRKNGLLPALPEFGMESYTQRKTGRPNRGVKSGALSPDEAGFVCTVEARAEIRRAWRKYKKPDISNEKAYVRYLEECHAESVIYVTPTQVQVKVKSLHLCPTLEQFTRHGPGNDPDHSARRLSVSAKDYENNHRGLVGKANDGILVGGLVGVADSTSADQVLSSVSSRLMMLSSPWVTRIHEGLTDYILGVHVHFQKPSALTHLAAVLNTAEDKVKFAAKFNHQIQAQDWIGLMPRRIRADNGEGKTVASMCASAFAEIGNEFVALGAAARKSPVESGHASAHRNLDWLLPATTHGRMKARGDRSEDDFCLNFDEYVHLEIDRILEHNNAQQVPHLLDIEMRQQGVGATRREILEYLMETGRCASEPCDLTSLRLASQPRLGAVLHKDGLHLFDPRNGSKRQIPQLVYWAPVLEEQRLTEQARRKVIYTFASIDPSCVGSVWVQIRSTWHELFLQNSDPAMHQITLFDWLSISDSDSLKRFLMRGTEVDTRVSRLATISAMTKNGQAEKALERSQPGAPSKTASRKGKRDSTATEIQLLQNRALGLGALRPTAPGATPAKTILHVDLGLSSVMDRIRASRKARK